MTTDRGYSQGTIDSIKKADPKLLGVRLGKLCIKKRISIITVAKEMGVSRQTVYSWFTGVWIPKAEHEVKLEKLHGKYASL